MAAAPEWSTTSATVATVATFACVTFAQTLPNRQAYGSHDRRPPADRAHLRGRGTCARRSRVGVECRDVRVLAELTGPEQRRPSTRLRAPRATSRGGARPGRGVGSSVGRSRCRRMRSITDDASISAISRKRPPSFDCAQDGPEQRRRAAARTHRPALAGERDEPVHTTVIAAKARKAARHPSTSLGMALSLLEGPGTRSAATRGTPASAKASAWLAGALRAKAACSTNRGSPSPSRRPAACARKVSKCSRTTRYTTPCEGSRGS